MPKSFPIVFDSNSGVSETISDIPSELDGSEGYWRDVWEDNLLQVNTDREAVLKWISTKQGSLQTQRAYRKEAERLLLWCMIVEGKALSSLLPEDFDTYKEFLADPPSDWITESNRKYRRSNVKWRPFAEKLSEKSQRQALVIIKGMLTFLQNTGYLRKNVLAGGLSAASNLTKRKSGSEEVRRAPKTFSTAEWNLVLDQVETLCFDNSEMGRFEYERSRWLVTLMMSSGRRIEEIASHTMGAFEQLEVEYGKMSWFLMITGKGDVFTQVPVSDKLLKALKRFRIHLGLTALPTLNEKTPLVPSKRFKKFDPDTNPQPTYVNGVGSRQLYNILTNIFKDAADSLPETMIDVKTRLRSGYPHMIRHTAITRYGRHNDIKLQQEFAGHSDPKTTMIYNQNRKLDLIDGVNKMEEE